MANQEHLDILKQGIEVWNKWRDQHFELVAALDRIINNDELRSTSLSGGNFLNTDFSWSNLWENDLSKANLKFASLIRTNLHGANLNEADLSDATANGAFFEEATLKNAILTRANLSKADLSGADLSGADLRGANLFETNLSGADLSGANLEGASFARAILDGTNLTGANLTYCSVYGVSVWNVQLSGATQRNLVITLPDEPEITVDNLEVAQFIYLLLNNQKIRQVIDTITSKVVLILGRFTNERKPVLDALRDELRNHNYSPIVFDFVPSAKRDLTETISTLAHMSCFVIADITDAKSIPQELQAIIPYLPSVPVQPILQGDATEYAMFEHYERYPWVLPIYRYQDIPSLLASIKGHIIKSVEGKANEKEQAKQLEEEVSVLKEKVRKLEGRK